MMEVVAREVPLSSAIPAVPEIVIFSMAWREEVIPSRPITIPIALMQSLGNDKIKILFCFHIFEDRKKKGTLKIEPSKTT